MLRFSREAAWWYAVLALPFALSACTRLFSSTPHFMRADASSADLQAPDGGVDSRVKDTRPTDAQASSDAYADLLSADALAALGPPGVPHVVLTAMDTKDRTLTASATVSITIRRDLEASAWCLMEVAADGPVPAPPPSSSACFVPTRPTQTTLSALGERRVDVFLRDRQGRISPGAGSDTIEYLTNRPPQIFDDRFNIPADSDATVLDVLANDHDPDGDELLIVALGPIEAGSATINPQLKSISFAPPTGFSGPATFTYTVEDTEGYQVTATVHLQMGPTIAWVGAGSDAAWSTPANWSGGIVPGPADTVIFDGRCAARPCGPEIRTAIAVGGLRLATDFDGTLVIGAGGSLTVGDAGIVQMGGVFDGGSASLSSGGNVDLLGGRFISSSGVFSIGMRWNNHNGRGFTVMGGDFDANGGTLRFNGSKGGQLYTIVATVNVDKRLTLNNLELELLDTKNGFGNNGAVLRIASGDTLVVEGDLSMRDGKMVGGSVELRGNIHTFQQSTQIRAEGGLTPLVINGDKKQTYQGPTFATAPRVVMDTHGSLEPAAGVSSYSFSGLKMLYGRFVSPPNTLRFHFDDEYGAPGNSDDDGLVLLGGDFVNQSSSLYLDIWVGEDNAKGEVFRVQSATPLEFDSLTIRLDDYNSRSGNNNEWITVAADTVIKVAHNLTINDGKLRGGRIEVGGAARFNCTSTRTCAGGGTTQIVFNGTASQSLFQSSTAPGAVLPGSLLTIDKAAGAMTLTAPLVLGSTGQSLTVKSGSLLANGHDLTVDGTLTLEAGTEIQMGGGTLTPGTLVNHGTIVP